MSQQNVKIIFLKIFKHIKNQNQNVSTKCKDYIFSKYTNGLKTKSCHIDMALFLNLRFDTQIKPEFSEI